MFAVQGLSKKFPHKRQPSPKDYGDGAARGKGFPMERILFISSLVLAGSVFHLLSYLLPVEGGQSVEIVHDRTRLIDVAPGYERWCQPDGGTVRDSSSVNQIQAGGKFQGEKDEDWQ